MYGRLARLSFEEYRAVDRKTLGEASPDAHEHEQAMRDVAAQAHATMNDLTLLFGKPSSVRELCPRPRRDLAAGEDGHVDCVAIVEHDLTPVDLPDAFAPLHVDSLVGVGLFLLIGISLVFGGVQSIRVTKTNEEDALRLQRAGVPCWGRVVTSRLGTVARKVGFQRWIDPITRRPCRIAACPPAPGRTTSRARPWTVMTRSIRAGATANRS
ncbi:hypothetical protein [Polyangium sp. y55x31]|uniref:hypothetical protein n=1 Tax=Polyangium sp. y55x31 TaxID=3042688 RepID=UPI00248324AF|nr:hypothetical protein [Polyangium sp. y55x31]MDI1475114.1 hypothetical protein [Polyangium sp. y55x31]